MMSDTPQTDASAFWVSSPTDPEMQEEVVVSHFARQLERELAERLVDVNALMEDIRKGDDMLMAWFKAASPYATPGSLEEGLKDVERFRILSEYVAAIIWKKDSDLPPLGHLKSGFTIDDLRAWCDGASAPKCDHDLVVVEDYDLPQYCWFSRCRKCGAECNDPSELSAP